MPGLQFTYSYTGPADQGILIKNRGNNAIVDSQMGMPQKFYPSAGDSMFSNARQAYVKDSGGGTLLNGNYDSSQHIAMKKINAIGKGSTLKSTVSFQGKSNDTTTINSSLARVRGGGSVAPKKKGALANPFKSGGGSSVTGSGNRQYYAASFLDTNIYYTMAEVASHNKVDNIWIVYLDIVYNVTSYVSKLNSYHEHTNVGNNFFTSQYWGQNITHVINSNHNNTQSSRVIQMLTPYAIGQLKIKN